MSAKVLGFVARQLHVWHLRMRIHQELCDLTPIESRLPCDCREGRSAVRATLLIVGDDVTGRAPVPSELLSAGRLGGHRRRSRDRSPDAEGEPGASPKASAPVAVTMIAKRRRYHLISINPQDPISWLNSRYSIPGFGRCL
jgi:hypothetical protein